MTSTDPKVSPSAAERMRRYRERRRRGMRSVRISLYVSEIDTLIRMRLLTDEGRHDHGALQTAVLTIVYEALEKAA